MKIGFVLDLHGRVNNPIARIDNYMESILEKVEYILQNNDVIVFCGDILNAYLTGIQFLNKFLLLVTRYEAQGKIIKVIIGNHDIIGRNYDSYTETSLGTLLIGRSWLMQDIVEIENFRLVPLTFTNEGEPIIPKFRKDSLCNILVGHAYFNHPEFNDIWNIDESILKDFDYCVLGHDHQKYPIEEFYNCKLLRSGAISRMTIDDKGWQIQYPQITSKEGVYQDVPFKPDEIVFKLVDETKKELEQHKSNINKMIELLNVDMEESEFSLPKVLKELNCPKKYQDIIREVLNG